MFYSFKKHGNTTLGRYAYSKVARLWPALAFAIFLEIVFFNGNLFNGFFNALFLQCNGLSLNYTGINWYISPLFWTFLFYFGLHKLVKKKIILFHYSSNFLYQLSSRIQCKWRSIQQGCGLWFCKSCYVPRYRRAWHRIYGCNYSSKP